MLLETLIPAELTIAPNPLGLTQNLKLESIPIDAQTSFELWMPLPGSVLLPQEAALLKHDFTRLEEICANLVWLLNGIWVDEQERPLNWTVERWQDATNILRRQHFSLDTISVRYLPPAIRLLRDEDVQSQSWIIQPARWRFSFLELQPWKKGYKAVPMPVSLLISFGEPMIKSAPRAVA